MTREDSSEKSACQFKNIVIHYLKFKTGEVKMSDKTFNIANVLFILIMWVQQIFHITVIT